MLLCNGILSSKLFSNKKPLFVIGGRGAGRLFGTKIKSRYQLPLNIFLQPGVWWKKLYVHAFLWAHFSPILFVQCFKKLFSFWHFHCLPIGPPTNHSYRRLSRNWCLVQALFLSHFNRVNKKWKHYLTWAVQKESLAAFATSDSNYCWKVSPGEFGTCTYLSLPDRPQEGKTPFHPDQIKPSVLWMKKNLLENVFLCFITVRL